MTEPVSESDTGEPTISAYTSLAVMLSPHEFSPAAVGSTVIMLMDQIALMMTVDVTRRQPELYGVMQLYAAERPSILEGQKPLAVREGQA